MTGQEEDQAKRQGRRQERGSNDSPESPDKSGTSDIPGLPFGNSASGKDCRVKVVLGCFFALGSSAQRAVTSVMTGDVIQPKMPK